MIIPDIRKILHAADLSEYSRHAFAYAAGIANRYGAGVTVLHVIEEFQTDRLFLDTKEKSFKMPFGP